MCSVVFVLSLISYVLFGLLLWIIVGFWDCDFDFGCCLLFGVLSSCWFNCDC